MLNKFTIQKDRSIKDSMIKINRNSIATLFVLNKKKLVGAVTDGDIRRALIRHLSMDVLVTELMNVNPSVADVVDSKESIHRIMSESNIARVPIVDAKGKICKIFRY